MTNRPTHKRCGDCWETGREHRVAANDARTSGDRTAYRFHHLAALLWGDIKELHYEGARTEEER